LHEAKKQSKYTEKQNQKVSMDCRKEYFGKDKHYTVRNPPPSHALCYTGNIPHPPPPPHPAPAQTYQIKKIR